MDAAMIRTKRGVFAMPRRRKLQGPGWCVLWHAMVIAMPYMVNTEHVSSAVSTFRRSFLRFTVDRPP
jgi:hypothetical protein